jgi:hypothetical protein
MKSKRMANCGHYKENVMAKKFLLVLVLAGVAAGGVFAQEAGGLDFKSSVPQFFSFDLGAGAGYALDGDLPSQSVGVTAVGFKVSVIDDLDVGVDVLSTIETSATGNSKGPAFVGVRVGYRFTPALGVAIGVGKSVVQARSSTPAAEPGISLGVFYDLFANRSSNGIATALKVRVDYVTETSDVGKGVLLFTPACTIGL